MMVTPNGEPWIVDNSKDGIDIYNTDGNFKFGIELQYSNTTLEEVKRLILCFNACLGIPEGALESAIEDSGIWSAGYNVGIGKTQEVKDTEQCIFRDCLNTDLVLGITDIGKVCNTHSMLFSPEKVHTSQCPDCGTIVQSDSITGLTFAVNTHVCL